MGSCIYLSRPSVVLPETRLDNEEVLRQIRSNFKGTDRQWSRVEGAVKHVFKICNTCYRYIENDPSVRVAEFAARAAKECLGANNVSPQEIDLLIYGGIAREYFEPATAMEVAAALGIKEVHAFDITSACVGLLEAIHVASAYINMHQNINTVLVCSAELTRGYIDYDIQSPTEVKYKAAGLTIGNAAAAWLIQRAPFPAGGIRLLAMDNFSLPEHWHLCYVPIDGSFMSYSSELFELAVYVVPELQRFINEVGWTQDEVEHYVFHQPSDEMVNRIMNGLGDDPAKAVKTHSLFANTSSTTVPLALDYLLRQGKVRNGHKLILGSAASGFTMVTAAGVWEEV